MIWIFIRTQFFGRFFNLIRIPSLLSVLSLQLSVMLSHLLESRCHYLGTHLAQLVEGAAESIVGETELRERAMRSALNCFGVEVVPVLPMFAQRAPTVRLSDSFLFEVPYLIWFVHIEENCVGFLGFVEMQTVLFVLRDLFLQFLLLVRLLVFVLHWSKLRALRG